MEKYLKDALEIVKAQACICTMTGDQMAEMIQKLTLGIKAVNEGSDLPTSGEKFLISPAKAIKEKSITCAICGKSFKFLTKKHLASHSLSPEEYREQCGYKRDTPLVCKALQRERRKKSRTATVAKEQE